MRSPENILLHTLCGGKREPISINVRASDAKPS